MNVALDHITAPAYCNLWAHPLAPVREDSQAHCFYNTDINNVRQKEK